MGVLCDLDLALPALAEAFDVERVSPRLEQAWQAAVDEPVTVEACVRRDAVYVPGARCVVTYDIASGASEHTIGAVEVTPSAVHHRLFHQDPRLPRLAAAVDLGAMRTRLRDHGELQELTPLRYKPGRSCVVAYRLERADDGRELVGKLFRDRGEEVMSTTVALHAATREATGMPRVLRPLAYLEDLQLLLQPRIAPGGELRVLAFDPALPVEQRLAWLRAAGIGLDALHSTVEAPGPPRTIEDDLRLLERYGEVMQAIAPDHARAFDNALAAISGAASRLHEPAAVASHGAFRLDQLLLDEGRLVLIDVDGFCWANPARDVGNLLAYLDWKAIRLPEETDFVRRAQKAFLAGYATQRPRPAEPWLTLYWAASMLKIAGRRYRGLAFDEWPLVPELLAAARDRLAG